MSAAKTRHALRIAIDGPTGVGKTVVGRRVAEELAYRFFDTGMVYRALALVAIENNVSPDDEDRLAELARRVSVTPAEDDADNASSYRALFEDQDVTAGLQSPAVSQMASQVSALRLVRQSLLELQRRVIEPGEVVAAGRDVGTVVAPEAELKVFLAASSAVRARRRHQQMLSRGEDVDYQTVLAAVEARDERDANRTVSPTRPADDAIIVQTDGMTIEEEVEMIVELAGRPVKV